MKLLTPVKIEIENPHKIIYIEIISNNIYLYEDDLKINDIISIQFINRYEAIVKHNKKEIIKDGLGLYFHNKKDRETMDMKPIISWIRIYTKQFNGFNDNADTFFNYTTEQKIRENKINKLIK